MREYLQGNLDRATDAWGRLSTNRKIILGVLVVATILAFIGAIFWVRSPEYVPLYSGLRGRDAAEMILQLKDREIPYKQKGDQIFVPDTRLEEALVAVSMDGLPREAGGIVGWEIFDKRQFGATDFQQRVNFQRALQGQLIRTINRFPGVRQTGVQLTIPEKSLFKEEQEEAKAWVSVQTDSSGDFGLEQASAVANLVAHTHPELKANNVAVLVNGINVSEAIKKDPLMDGAPAPVDRLEAQKKYDKYLEQKVQNALEKILGQDKAIVLVNTEIDYSEREINSKIFAPPVEGETEGIARSRYEERESYEGTGIGEPVGGEPGVASNVPGYVGDEEGAGGDSEYDSRKTLINYEMNEKTEHISQPPGKIEKISASVFVDESILADVESIRQAVAAAVGANLNPGDDEVVVEGMKFVEKVDEPGKDIKVAGMIPKDWMPLIQMAIVAFIVIFVLGFLRAALRPKAAIITQPPGRVVDDGEETESEIDAEEQAQKEADEQAQREADEQAKKDADEQAQKEADEQAKQEEEDRKKQIRDDIIEFARENPDMVAGILGIWLLDEEEEESS